MEVMMVDDMMRPTCRNWQTKLYARAEHSAGTLCSVIIDLRMLDIFFQIELETIEFMDKILFAPTAQLFRYKHWKCKASTVELALTDSQESQSLHRHHRCQSQSCNTWNRNFEIDYMIVCKYSGQCSITCSNFCTKIFHMFCLTARTGSFVPAYSSHHCPRRRQTCHTWTLLLYFQFILILKCFAKYSFLGCLISSNLLLSGLLVF